ncbi:hypothetical protein TNCV_4069431 [Trichonephila clavipes]|nr:hypothetical protein TNCV_4069431 [Trichonephila clavipes]
MTGKLEEECGLISVAEEFLIIPSVFSHVWKAFQNIGTAVRKVDVGSSRKPTVVDDGNIVLLSKRTRCQSSRAITQHLCIAIRP